MVNSRKCKRKTKLTVLVLTVWGILWRYLLPLPSSVSWVFIILLKKCLIPMLQTNLLTMRSSKQLKNIWIKKIIMMWRPMESKRMSAKNKRMSKRRKKIIRMWRPTESKRRSKKSKRISKKSKRMSKRTKIRPSKRMRRTSTLMQINQSPWLWNIVTKNSKKKKLKLNISSTNILSFHFIRFRAMPGRLYSFRCSCFHFWVFSFTFKKLLLLHRSSGQSLLLC